MSSTWSRCPLCRADSVDSFAYAHGRTYRRCAVCRLVHVAPEHRLSRPAEFAEYATHQNDAADPGYRAFLDRVATPLALRLPEGAEGLDYGSGPGPTLSRMLEEQGFPMTIYDPFFAPDPQALERTYDFITCTETVEHFFEPGDEFDRLNELLRPAGLLAVMTEPYSDGVPFEHWRYARELSHVSFYHVDTMVWIGNRYGWEVNSPRSGVFLFDKPF